MTVKYQIHEAHDLHHQVHFALTQNLYVRNRDIQYHITDDNVVLNGTVRSFYQKQMVQESLRKISGIGQIQNDLKVVVRAR